MWCWRTRMKVRAEWLRRSNDTSRAILAIAVLILSVAGASSLALAQSGAASMNHVNAALQSNPRLNGAKAYTAAEGVVVLYGLVFDDKDRAMAEQTAMEYRASVQSSIICGPKPANGSRKRSASSSSSR